MKPYPLDPHDRYTNGLLRSINASIEASEYVIEYETYNPRVETKYWYKYTITDELVIAECRADYEYAIKKVGGFNVRQMRMLLNGEIDESTR